MNTCQSLLVIGAFALLAVLTLAVNSTILTTTKTGLEMEANLCALSVAESAMDEVLSKFLDTKVVDGTRITNPSAMSPTASLGPDGESAAKGIVDSSRTDQFSSRKGFNDVDDYNSNVRRAWDPQLGWIKLNGSVAYLNDSTLNVQSSPPSFHKQITLSVTNPYMTKNDSGIFIPLVFRILQHTESTSKTTKVSPCQLCSIISPRC